MSTNPADTALRQALGLRLEQWRARLQADAPDAAIWTEIIDTTRGELRLLAPRQTAHRLRKRLQQPAALSRQMRSPSSQPRASSRQPGTVSRQLRASSRHPRESGDP